MICHAGSIKYYSHVEMWKCYIQGAWMGTNINVFYVARCEAIKYHIKPMTISCHGFLGLANHAPL